VGRPDEVTDPAGRELHALFTDRSHGDLAIDAAQPGLGERRAAVAPGPWTWLRQVHGAEVVVVNAPGDGAGAPADAAVTRCTDAVLAVQTADCAAVLLAGRSGERVVAIGAAHAGWRGLEAGVLERTVETLRSLGADEVTWRLGPCISPAAYEFGEHELDLLAARFGDVVRSRTAEGHAALDLRAGVRAALERVEAVEQDPGVAVDCTATDGRYYSHRARGDVGRQAGVTWLTAPHPAGRLT
jgi:YfiH family protein